MNKTKLIIILLFLILVALIGLLVFSPKKNTPNIEPIPVYTPTSPTPAPIIQGATSQQQELQAEQNYAKERQKILSERPWILKMPIKNEDYFLTYDTELDVFDVTIYISSQSPADDQLNRIKQRINIDLTSIGVDVNKAKINYTEKQI